MNRILLSLRGAAKRRRSNPKLPGGLGIPRRTRGYSTTILFSLLASLILTSCAQTVSGVTPTPLFADVAATQPEVQAELTPTLAPFRFDLPTPGEAPVSGWRPPLYPIPWAPTSYDHFYFARPIAADQVNWPLADYR